MRQTLWAKLIRATEKRKYLAMQLKSTACALQTDTTSGRLPKYKQRRFTPGDDRCLLRCRSFAELRAMIRAVAGEAHYSERAVKRHAQKLGIWAQLAPPRRQITVKERVGIKPLLRVCNTKEQLLEKISAKLRVDIEDARRLLYRDATLSESLREGTYSLREVAEGLCMRPARVRQIIEEGRLRMKQLQRSGKLFITSESISDFVRTDPRTIDWQRCLRKSLWLKDILESTRQEELAVLLCVSKRKIQSWIENGFLTVPFDPDRIGELFGDESVYRFLDEYPGLVDLAKCSAKSPDWFARYAEVQGRYRKIPVPHTGRDADRESYYYLALGRR